MSRGITRTVTVPGGAASNVTFADVVYPDSPYGFPARIEFLKQAGDGGDCWVGLNAATATAGGANVSLIPDGSPYAAFPTTNLGMRERWKANAPNIVLSIFPAGATQTLQVTFY